VQPEEVHLLRHGAASLGAQLDDVQIGQFERFASLLHEANRRLNLTRIPPEQTVPLHFLDSLAVCRAVDMRRIHSLADVGSGAGFPGLPLKIAFPHLEVALIEATQKKARFLEEVVQDLGLSGVRVLAIRAETLGGTISRAGAFDAAVARAVARLSRLLEWMLPLVRVGGLVIALKSRAADEELAEVLPRLTRLRANLIGDVPLVLPGTDVHRRILVFEKVGSTRRS